MPLEPAAASSRQPDPAASLKHPLRVCHIAYTFYESDNRVMRYADAVSQRGGEVEVIALRRRGQTRSGSIRGVRLFRIQRRTVSETQAWSYLVKIAGFLFQAAVLVGLRHARNPYDVVHVHNVPDFLVFAAIVPKWLGARVILDIHDILPELYAGKFGGRSDSVVFRVLSSVERGCCAFADHVIVANHIWQARLLARSVPASKCTTIMNYPDLTLFKPAPSRERPPGSAFVMLYPGSLNHHQGVDVAVRAFARASERMPGAELHIYGEGPDRPHLARLKDQLGIAGRVRIRDPLPIEEIGRVMQMADLGVEPKYGAGFAGEAMSTKILEFMACRVPVVVSRTQVHAYYFDDTVVRFFDPGDVADLAEALVQAYEGDARSRSRVESAAALAARYSWQERVRDYTGLLDALLAPAEEVRTAA